MCTRSRILCTTTLSGRMSDASVFKPLLGEFLAVICKRIRSTSTYLQIKVSAMASSLVRLRHFVLFSPLSHVIPGVGFFFAALMLVLTYVQSKFSDHSPSSSEEFSVRAHIIARDIFTHAVDRLHREVSRYVITNNRRATANTFSSPARPSLLRNVSVMFYVCKYASNEPNQSKCMDMECDPAAV